MILAALAWMWWCGISMVDRAGAPAAQWSDILEPKPESGDPETLGIAESLLWDAGFDDLRERWDVRPLHYWYDSPIVSLSRLSSFWTAVPKLRA